jgi:hypothetical protein
LREWTQLAKVDLDASVIGKAPLIKIDEVSDAIKISYTFPGFYLSEFTTTIDDEDLAFQEVKIAATGFVAESGKPLLPSFGRYVQIPPFYNHTVTVEKSDSRVFDDVLVLPAQELLTDDAQGKGLLEYDHVLYGTDVLYPENVEHISGPYFLDDYQVLLAHIRPIQYNPVKKQLVGHGSVEVTIELSPMEDMDLPYPEYAREDPVTAQEAFGNLVLNPRRGIIRWFESRFIDRALPPMIEHQTRYLVIYDDKLRKSAETLANWKNRRGMPTETVSAAAVGGTSVEIKRYIRQRRGQTPRLRYVLLLGDVNMIPTEVCDLRGLEGPNATDYYYSTPRDPEGPSDLQLPWLSVGRIPVRTAQEGMDVVKQIVDYEKNPPKNPRYYRRMTFAAFFQDTEKRDPVPDGRASREYVKTMERIRTHLTDIGIVVTRVYVSEHSRPRYYRNGAAVPREVIQSIVSDSQARRMLKRLVSQGQLIVTHRNHGNEDGWGRPRFDVSDLNQMRPKHSSIFYSINCLTGSFDLSGSMDCFAEVLLKKNGTAPSLVAATRESHTFLNDDLMEALFDALWPGIIEGFPGGNVSYSVKSRRLGDILNYAKSYLLTRISHDVRYVRDHLEIYHLIGDPTLELWKHKPRVIDMDVSVQGRQLLIVLSDCPCDSVITIWHNDRLIKRLEPYDRIMRISLVDQVPVRAARTRIDVCFWAPGYRYAEVPAILT